MVKPSGVRNAAQHKKDLPNRMFLNVTGLVVAPPHRLKVVSAFQRNDFRVGLEGNIGDFFNTASEIP